jgi:hypothetical protein
MLYNTWHHSFEEHGVGANSLIGSLKAQLYSGTFINPVLLETTAQNTDKMYYRLCYTLNETVLSTKVNCSRIIVSGDKGT